MFEKLSARGFEIAFQSHAKAILEVDFREAADELEAALLGATIPIEEIIAGGGGEAKGTQRLRRALQEKWPLTTFRIEKIINGTPREEVSHKVDHVRSFPNGDMIALEIEWNNKDAFYDRDLENFKRLHADGAISVGVVVTRGASLQDNMRTIVRRFLDERQIQSLEDMAHWGYEPTSKQRKAIAQRQARTRNPMTFREAFTDKFVSDKFGEATTHWRKLEDRLRKRVGNPCPMVLIGLPESIVTFDEGKAALAEVEAFEAEQDEAEG